MIWLSGVDMLGDKCTAVVCEAILPAVQMLQDGDDADSVTKFVRTEMNKLTGTEDMGDYCGIVGSGTMTIKPWEPAAAAASERQRLTKLATPAFASVNLDLKSEALQSLNLYACDLNRLTDVWADLLRVGRVKIVSRWGANDAAARRRTVALTVCTAALHARRYEHVLRVASAEDLRQASAGSSANRLIWLDFVGSTTTADAHALYKLLETDIRADANVIMTCDDGFSSDEASADVAEDLAELLKCIDVQLEEETGRLLDVRHRPDYTVELVGCIRCSAALIVLQKLLDGRPVIGIYHADEADEILFRVSVSDVAFLHGLRDEFLQEGAFDRRLEAALRDVPRRDGKDSLGELSVQIDSHFAERYDSSILRLNKLTPHQREKLDEVRDTDASVHVKAPAGAGKTFLALHQSLELLQNDESAVVLFVAKNSGLVFFVVGWIAERVDGRTRKINRLLSRLHLLFDPFTDGPRVATVQPSVMQDMQDTHFIHTTTVEKRSDYALIVVDEAHHIFRDEQLRATIEGYAGTRRMLLSDVSQGLHDGVPFPDGLRDIRLQEVVRCSNRVVSAARKFQQAGSDMQDTYCHHDSDGPPLKSFLYDDDTDDDAARFELCAAQTMSAFEHVTSSFSTLNLNGRLAIIVPDAEFRQQLAPILQSKLANMYPDRFEMLDAAQASRVCILNGGRPSKAGKERIVMDDISQLDGMEFLVVICIGLDARIVSDASEATFAESRSQLYRGITRAHMLALAVNEFVKDGWLAYLTTVRLREDKRFDADEAIRISREQQAMLDADKQRRQEQQAKTEAYMEQNSLSSELSDDEFAFVKQQIRVAVTRQVQDLTPVLSLARTVTWPRQQQLNRIPQLVAEVVAVTDAEASRSIRQLATANVSRGGFDAKEAVESALGSWSEAGSVLAKLIDEKQLNEPPAEQLSLQAGVLSELARGSDMTIMAAGTAVLKRWALDEKVRRALEQLEEQVVASVQLRSLQFVVEDSLRRGKCTKTRAVADALALWQAVETALKVLAEDKNVDDALVWVQVADIVDDCIGLDSEALKTEVVRGVAAWEERRLQNLELQKQEQSIWETGGNATTRTAEDEVQKMKLAIADSCAEMAEYFAKSQSLASASEAALRGLELCSDHPRCTQILTSVHDGSPVAAVKANLLRLGKSDKYAPSVAAGLLTGGFDQYAQGAALNALAADSTLDDFIEACVLARSRTMIGWSVVRVALILDILPAEAEQMLLVFDEEEMDGEEMASVSSKQLQRMLRAIGRPDPVAECKKLLQAQADFAGSGVRSAPLDHSSRGCLPPLPSRSRSRSRSRSWSRSRSRTLLRRRTALSQPRRKWTSSCGLRKQSVKSRSSRPARWSTGPLQSRPRGSRSCSI